MRFYFCQTAGTGTDVDTDPYRSCMSDIVPGLPHGDDDLRDDGGQSPGWMISWCDPTQSEHDTLVADPRVIYLPLETTGGALLGLDDLIGDIDPTKRAAMKSRLEDRHIPMDDLTVADPIRKAISRIIRRIRIKSALLEEVGASVVGNNFTEALETTISQINAAKRQKIDTLLQAAGFDTSVILGTDTVKEALQKLSNQDIPFLANEFD